MFEAVVLGLVQGLTEFIPISSSGHLVIFQTLFGQGSDHLFLEWINIGTFLALLVYFRHRIWGILQDVFQKHKYALARNILLTAIPAGAVGFVLSDFIDSSAFFGSIVVVLVTLAVVGLIMVLVEKLPHLSGVETLERLQPKRAIGIGTVQILALIPGVSRSGSTIIAGRIAGLSPAKAAEYSFLASLPIMAGVTLKVLLKDMSYFQANTVTLLVANLVAFISGLLAVGLLMKYLSRHSLVAFGWYRIGLAAVVGLVLLVQ